MDDYDVLGTGCLSMRPLRYLFDVDADIALLAPTIQANGDRTLVNLHVYIGIEPYDRPSRRLIDETDRESTASIVECEDDELHHYKGKFVKVTLRTTPTNMYLASDSTEPCLMYQFHPNGDTFQFPMRHENTMKILVTEALLTHIDKAPLSFQAIQKQIQDTDKDDDDSKDAADTKEDMLAVKEKEKEQFDNLMQEHQQLLQQFQLATGQSDEAIQLMKHQLLQDAQDRDALQDRMRRMEEATAEALRRQSEKPQSKFCTLQ